MHVGVSSLGQNDNLLIAVDKASKFPFGFPLLSKEVDCVARQLLQLCIIFGFWNIVQCDGGKEFATTVIQLYADV